MANKTLDTLPAISSVAVGDELAVYDVSATDTTKATITQLAAGLPAATASLQGAMSASDKAKLDTSTSSATASAVMQRDGSGNAAVNVLTAASVTLSLTPTASTDAATKGYVDSFASGVTIKTPCRVATTANIANVLTGAPATLDGVSLSTSDRILVKDQSTNTQNGIYTVTTVGSGANGVWARATDADTGAELPTGSYVFVTAGTLRASTAWVMNTAGTITIGVSAIVFVLYSQITSIPATAITGQLTAAQIADAILTTAKFAAGITPVELKSTMPTSANFQGRTVYLTATDGSFAADKMYRWTNAGVTTGTTYWTSVVPTTDLTGQITTTQITDSAVTTAKINAGAITAAKITAGTITSNELAANSVIAGKIAAGAISATEIAANAVTATQIAAGAVTATKISVANLGAISANIGTITAGTISGVSITSTTGAIAGFTLGSSTMSAGSGSTSILLNSSLLGPTIQLGDYTTSAGLALFNSQILMTGTGGTSAFSVIQSSGAIVNVRNSSGTANITLTGSTGVIESKELASKNGDGWTPKMSYSSGGQAISFQWTGSVLKVRIDSTELTVATS